MSIIALNLVDNQLAHIKDCNGPAMAWKILCDIHVTNNLSNILFICWNFFMCKMQRGDELLVHINKIKARVDQLACLEIYVRNKYVVMILLKNLSPLYEHLITPWRRCRWNNRLWNMWPYVWYTKCPRGRQKFSMWWRYNYCCINTDDIIHLGAKPSRRATSVANRICCMLLLQSKHKSRR